MHCDVCGAELQPGEQECIKCKNSESGLQVLTPDEKKRFKGITIDDEEELSGAEESYEYRDSQSNQRIYVRHVNFSSPKIGFFTKLLIGLVLAGLVFVVLPIAVLFMVIIAIVWFLLRR
ncbi:MAG TPA: hypothetical protein VGL27_08535 [Negativicutes bacterium]